ncbi:MAG TPA: hypothetical protein VFN76_09995 [Candidatus Limnocylindria bacterium]|nr:hypothetical protein [Candidatus Limnocylindria bacterium]
MATTTDAVSQVVEACIAILDRAAEIEGLTGRDHDNLVPWRRAALASPPILGLRLTGMARGGGATGDFRRVTLRISAWAPLVPPEPGQPFGDAQANAMLGAVERLVTAKRLFETAQLDVYGEPLFTRSMPPPDPELQAAQADLDVLMTVRFA